MEPLNSMPDTPYRVRRLFRIQGFDPLTPGEALNRHFLQVKRWLEDLNVFSLCWAYRKYEKGKKSAKARFFAALGRYPLTL